MRVLYLQGFDAGGLVSAVDKTCAAIARGDLRSADVRKLRGDGTYHRARLNDSDRLLLQFVRHHGETVCLVLEVIVRHAYDKSRFLRGAQVPDDALETAYEPTTLLSEAAPTLRYLDPARTEFRMLDKPLCFDDAQEAALRARPPLVVVGSAGSGKTALLLQAMRTHRGSVAYVTESRWLAESARTLYVANGGAPDDQDASFLSLMHMVESIAVPPGPIVSWRAFRGFFAERSAGSRVLREAGAHAILEELRGVLTAEPEGPHSREAYRALGVKQSLFGVEQRDAIYDFFLAYRDWLVRQGLSEPNLLAHALLGRVEPVWDFVVVDEVQDLTNAQLALVLATLRPHAGFILAGDANQIVHPNYFSWARVKSLFWRGRGALDEDQAVHLLRMSYRNSERVTDVANRLLALKVHCYGSIDRESNRLMQSLPGDAGATLVLRAGGPGARALAERCRVSNEVAVLVLREEHKAEAQRTYRTPLVFSIVEAKGLEYRTVVLHRLISGASERYAALAAGVSASDLQTDELRYRRARDKTDKSLEADKFFVNALYVALTRAVHDVVAVEDDPAHPLLVLLGLQGQDSADDVAVHKASREDWQREASRLEAQGKSEQAEAIRRDVLQQKPVPWQVYDRAWLGALLGPPSKVAALSVRSRDQLREYAYLHDDPDLLLQVDPLRGVVEATLPLPTWVRGHTAYGWPPVDSEATRNRALALLLGLPLKGEREVFDQRRPQVVPAALSRCVGKSRDELLRDTERHGTDHRTMFGLTQLMLAAYRNDLAWIDALIERGATLGPLDTYGRGALGWALLGARDRGDLGSLGELWERLAPASIDVEVDGQAVQLGREMPEFLVLQFAIAEHSRMLRQRHDLSYYDASSPDGDADQATAGFHVWPTFSSAELCSRWWEAGLPENLLPARRARRAYLNAVLARAERQSTYRPARKLWQRVRHGRYCLSPTLRLRVRDEVGVDHWRDLRELLGLAQQANLRRATYARLTGDLYRAEQGAWFGIPVEPVPTPMDVSRRGQLKSAKALPKFTRAGRHGRPSDQGQ